MEKNRTRRLAAIAVLLGAVLALAAPASANPAIAIVTSRNNAVALQQAAAVKQHLVALRGARHIEELSLQVFTVDLADAATARFWKQAYGVTPADIPAILFVERTGNRIKEAGPLMRRFSEPRQAAADMIGWVLTRVPSLASLEIPVAHVASIPVPPPVASISVPAPVAAAPIQPAPPPRPTTLRLAVYLQVEDFYHQEYRRNSGWPPHVDTYHIDFDRPALLSFIRNRLGQLPNIQIVESSAADLVLRADFRGDMDTVRGTFTLLDGTGVVLAEDSAKVGMCMAFDTNLSGPAMKRAREVAERLLPGIMGRVASQTAVR